LVAYYIRKYLVKYFGAKVLKINYLNCTRIGLNDVRGKMTFDFKSNGKQDQLMTGLLDNGFY